MGLAMHIPPACHSPLAFKPEPSPLPTRLPTPPVIRARYSSISHDTASGSGSSSSRSQPLDRLFMPGHPGRNEPNAVDLFCADEAHIVPVPHSQKRKCDESDPSIPSSAHFGPALQHSKREAGPSVIDMTEDEGRLDVIDLTKGEVVGSADVIDLTKDED
ncbi:hypothetical protein WOLCODRAFT_141392 [Wolfiporia cocos MD-104 SS10]|uniref:Uncharacterized protein n=1 Tax=Wolfiporia cocos (strain MD-104) TaxID=742152 RepID=A0A2H3JHN0_WOLCO|nr:hypothetical protein WOLCODRAFT_141392 [Wolfiporia cocos MD-104 SS10]